MKRGPIIRLCIIVAIACLSIAAVRFIDTIPARHLASLVGVSLSISEPTPIVTSSPQPDVSSIRSVDDIIRSSVAVQTFFKAVLVRSGSGVVVSSDGLILTVASVAPYGSGSFTYQVATSSGEVLRARSVWRRAGMVLLKVDSTNLGAVFFNSSTKLVAGQSATVTGGFVSLSHYLPVMLSISIPYVVEENIPISMDRSFAALVAGGQVTDGAGNALGILVSDLSIGHIISAHAVNDFLVQYLATIQKQ